MQNCEDPCTGTICCLRAQNLQEWDAFATLSEHTHQLSQCTNDTVCISQVLIMAAKTATFQPTVPHDCYSKVTAPIALQPITGTVYEVTLML